MKRDNRIKKIKKRSYTFSVVTGIASVICVAVIVFAIYTSFMGYVFYEIYSSNAKASSEITKMVAEHIISTRKKVSNCADRIGKLISGNDEFTDVIKLKQAFEFMDTENDFVNFDIKMFDENETNIGTLATDVEKTEFYRNALSEKYGFSVEKLNNTLYMIYTAPIKNNDKEVGVLYATERGQVDDVYYSYKNNESDKGKTGVRVCYITDANGEGVAYCGNGNLEYNWSDADKKKFSYSGEATSNDSMKMYIESANSEFGMTGEKFNISIIKNWMSDYKPIVYNNSRDDIELSNVWYKQKINDIRIGKDVELYTYIQVKTYVEYVTVVKLVYAAFFSMIILLIPFMLLLVSTISKIRSNRRMAGLLYIDSLTGYGNWTYFEESAGKILRKRRNHDMKFAMISFEIIRYHIILEYYGDGFEDEVLEKISERLKEWTGKNEVYARYAESQYGMLLCYEDEKELVKRVKRILDDLSGYISKVKLKMNFKAGIYLIEDKTMSVNAINLIAIGAKDSRTDSVETKVTMYSSKIREQQRKENMIEESMEAALLNKEFQVYLQPKYSPVNEELLGAEALVRWISKDRGIISPGEFIPVFEKNGFITKLDDYMIDAVAKLQADWKREGKKYVPVSVNVSRLHFADENLAEHIRDIVDRYDIEHEYIEIELTESAFYDDKDVLLNTIRKLHEYGFVVSMDDFGSGYSSLNLLKNIPLDIIKLDGEFFNEADDKERGETVVRNTIVLAKDLNMKIVAEGIETKEQVEFLEEQGCDLIQGFYFARPMPVADFEKLIS